MSLAEQREVEVDTSRMRGVDSINSGGQSSSSSTNASRAFAEYPNEIVSSPSKSHSVVNERWTQISPGLGCLLGGSCCLSGLLSRWRSANSVCSGVVKSSRTGTKLMMGYHVPLDETRTPSSTAVAASAGSIPSRPQRSRAAASSSIERSENGCKFSVPPSIGQRSVSRA
jgi:hypothetical protein